MIDNHATPPREISADVNPCPECERLRRQAEHDQRYCWRDGREAWARLVEHQTTCHIWHIATAPKTGA
jgi:hypothetical protein